MDMFTSTHNISFNFKANYMSNSAYFDNHGNYPWESSTVSTVKLVKKPAQEALN